MPKNTAVGIYISVFGTLACFAFVWNIIWLIVVSIIGIIVTFIIRGFNEHPEYTLKASEIQEIEQVREKKTPTEHTKPIDTDEDMGLVELVKVVSTFFLDAIRNKRWQKK